MPTPDSRREAIRRTLEECAGGASDAAAVAEATVGTWHQVADRYPLALRPDGLRYSVLEGANLDV